MKCLWFDVTCHTCCLAQGATVGERMAKVEQKLQNVPFLLWLAGHLSHVLPGDNHTCCLKIITCAS